jgi:hypothetical protein
MRMRTRTITDRVRLVRKPAATHQSAHLHGVTSSGLSTLTLLSGAILLRMGERNSNAAAQGISRTRLATRNTP